MDEFVKSLSSLSWWLSVVVVGILINLVSAYLKPRIDHRLLLTSSWWRKRSQERIERYEKELARLWETPHEEILLAIEGMRMRTEAIVSMILSTTVLAGGGLLFGYSRSIFSYLLLALGVWQLYSFSTYNRASSRIQGILSDLAARKEKKMLEANTRHHA